ncbi:MAG TPA: Crp/Fnr family transcriptional regulator [Microvirga sp.]|jgi:CRP-like cAMP-binding protein|nr:Crp/Fnr family transcriptional regulator [Microvirga sp.]
MSPVLIQKLEQHGPLTDEEKRVVEDSVARVAEFGPREDIVREGDCPTGSSVLLEGFAYRYNHLTNGTRQITAFHIAGDFCDLHSFLLKKLDDGVAAVTRCKVAFVPHQTLREITRQYPYLTRVFWMTTLVDGAVHREWMTGLGRLEARDRVAHALCELYVRLKSVGLTGDHSYDLPITQGELADAFGLSNVHTNRILQELRGSGLIDLRGKKLTILDWERLREVAQFDPEYLHIDQKLERD